MGSPHLAGKNREVAQNNALILDFVTADVDEMGARARQWNHQYRQLSTGLFCGSFFVYEIPGAQFGISQWSQAIQVTGTSPKNALTLAIPFNMECEAKWYGRTLALGDVMLPHCSRPHDFITLGRSTVWTIAIDRGLLKSLWDGELPEQLINGQVCVFQPPPIALIALNDYLRELFAMLRRSPKLAFNPAMQHLVQQDCLPLVITACSIPTDIRKTTRLSSRFELMKSIEATVMENPARPLTLHDLCQAFHTSKRNLHYTFQECTGMSPMAYLRAQRLNGIRHHLKTCTNTRRTITAIAQDWGFWHAGHFSQAYKAMFGETPSETLQQR